MFYHMHDLSYLDSITEPKRTILIVDDNPSSLLLAQRALGNTGAELILARSVEAALDFLKYRTPDILVTDLIFPEKSGFALLERLRNSTRLCAVPALVMSGTRNGELMDKAHRLGAAVFLSKPFPPQTLLERVNSYL